MASIEVEVTRPSADSLALSYVVIGEMGKIRLPPVTAPKRSDELWRHTCFEAFVRASSGSQYYEFNFAPSTCWAAYRFIRYREGMCRAIEINTPPIAIQSGADRCVLQTSINLRELAELPRDERWRLALSAIIEDANGGMSYWALAHPPGKPDFHHAEGFVCELSPAAQS